MSNLERYVRRNHRRVDGWLHHGAAHLIAALGRSQRSLGVYGPVAEIGVHHGRLFILLCLLTSDREKAVAIDLFEDQDKNIDQSGAGDRSKLISNLEKFADTSRVVIHQADSTTLDAQTVVNLAGGACRLFSVDGGHTPEITRSDLHLAEASLAAGGVIILDDCFNEMWPGVSMGTHHYFSQPRKTIPFAIGGNKTFFCEPQFVDRYIPALHGMAPWIAEREFLGRRVLCFDFTPPALTQRIGQIRIWKSIKNIPGIRLARSLTRLQP